MNNIKSSLELLKLLKIRTKKIILVLVPYYFFAILNASLEAIGMVLLVNVFTGESLKNTDSKLIVFLGETISSFGLSNSIQDLLPVLIGLFFFNLLLRFCLLSFDGYLFGILRRKLQETIFKNYLNGQWSIMRDNRTGDSVGTNTQESLSVAKFLTSAVQVLYHFLGAASTVGLALYTSFQTTLVLGMVGLPIILLMKYIFKIQANFSRQYTVLRNKFSADITDRFNGLLQIHADNTYNFHANKGLRSQPDMLLVEIKTAFCQGIIGSANLLLPLSALIGFFFWIKLQGLESFPQFSLIASVGILGMRISTQVNGCISSIGNLSRLSGSLIPVIKALKLPKVLDKNIILEKVNVIDFNKISYAYGSKVVFSDLTFSLKTQAPIILNGRSGKGKTTLANIIAGLYEPTTGTIEYKTSSGTSFSSTSHKTNVGFVTQDIYMFGDSLRENLTSGRELSDEAIWEVLKEVDASEFVKELGGLETQSSEAGRSLSGGQRRRLGIARVLLSGSQVLIFDEVTAGLDPKNRTAVNQVIENLSQKYISVIISHEETSFDNQQVLNI